MSCSWTSPREVIVMAWFPIALTDAEEAIVNDERDTHPAAHGQRA